MNLVLQYNVAEINEYCLLIFIFASNGPWFYIFGKYIFEGTDVVLIYLEYKGDI